MCAQCAVGSYCPTASTKSTCSAGTYSNTTGATDISACLACGLGTYSLSAGASTCLVVRAFELCESAIVLLYAELDSHCECVSLCPFFPRHFAWIIPARTMFLCTGRCGCMSLSTLSFWRPTPNGSVRRALIAPLRAPCQLAPRERTATLQVPQILVHALHVVWAPIHHPAPAPVWWYERLSCASQQSCSYMQSLIPTVGASVSILSEAFCVDNSGSRHVSFALVGVGACLFPLFPMAVPDGFFLSPGRTHSMLSGFIQSSAWGLVKCVVYFLFPWHLFSQWSGNMHTGMCI
jgi:hypothetical protein